MKRLPSFGVGRIRSLYLNPFSFDEFLWTQNLDTYIDDFSKYKSRISPLILSNTLKSVALQAGNKFVYSEVGRETSTLIKEALDLLSLAGLIIPVIHTAANGIPLGAEINTKYRKYLFLDHGLMLSLLGLQATDILLSDETDFVSKGGLSEMFAGLELLKYSNYLKNPEIYYWQRTERNAQAEVDYVISINGDIFPVEVKDNRSGSKQSLYVFLNNKGRGLGYRVSIVPLASYSRIKVIPLYALSTLLKGI